LWTVERLAGATGLIECENRALIYTYRAMPSASSPGSRALPKSVGNLTLPDASATEKFHLG
jgi:hypothetical protein